MKKSSNKYLATYYNIISNARKRGLNRTQLKKTFGYIEIHHIIPKCLGGSDSEFNLVALSFKEHYICHLLLSRIFKNNYSIVQSFFLMSHIVINSDGRRTGKKVSAKLAAEFKEFTQTHKKPVSQETIEILRRKNSGVNNPNFGKKRDKLACEKASASLKEYYRTVPKEKENLRRKNVSNALKGKKKSRTAVNNAKRAKVLKRGKASAEIRLKRSISSMGHSVSEKAKTDLAEKFGFAIEYTSPDGKLYKFPSISSAVKYLKENNILNRSFKYIKNSCVNEINGFKFVNKINIMSQKRVKGPDGIIYDSLTKCAEAFNTTRASLLLWIRDYPELGFSLV